MKHLFLALSRAGWGETILGIRIAKELESLGDVVQFVAHDSSSPLFAREKFVHQLVSDQIAPLLQIHLDKCLADSRPNTIILSDYYTASLFLHRARLGHQFLHAYDIPLIAIDTWDYNRSGSSIDLFTDMKRPIANWICEIPNRLLPCPIIRPETQTGVYKNLQEPIQLTKKVRNHVRSDIGISSTDKALLFCTAQWQHAKYSSDHGRRIAELVPELIGNYIRKLGSDVHLVHVGPKQNLFDRIIGKRYHWFPSMAPSSFDNLFASSDALLSLNSSASTITKALVSEIPVIVLQNKIRGDTIEQVEEQLHFKLSKDLCSWIRSALPIYPFSMWPLGYYEFLRPLLTDNPYCRVINLVEMLDEESVLNNLRAVLFRKDSRYAVLERQANYVRKVSLLPSGGSLIKNYVGT